MALNGIMMGLASIIIFAAIAPIGRKSGVAGLFVLASIMSLAGLIGTWLFLKERLPETQKKEGSVFKEVLGVVMQSPALKSSYLCSLISRADITVMATFIITWAVQDGVRLQLASEQATLKGSIPMIIMSVVTFLAFPIIGVLLDKWGRLPTIIVTLVSGGLGLIWISVCPSPFSGLVFGAVILVGIGIAGSIAGANTLAVDAAPKSLVGGILGGLNTMQPIGMLFFLQVGGYLYDVLGPGWAFRLKGIADILLAVWLLIASKSILAEMQQKKAAAQPAV
jgi:MFS family permease